MEGWWGPHAGRRWWWGGRQRQRGWLGELPQDCLGTTATREGRPPFPSKSHLQPLHHPLPAAVCLTVKTTAPAARQAPSPLLDLRLFLSSHHPLLHPPLCLLLLLHPPSARNLLLFLTFFLCQGPSAALVNNLYNKTLTLCINFGSEVNHKPQIKALYRH